MSGKLFLPVMAAMLMGNQANSASVDITVSGIRSTDGQLIACLWTDDSKFPTCQKNANAVRKSVKVSGSTMRVSFEGLKPGKYAVTVQHDEDSNGKLKTNFIGMPKEGVGVSNNPGGIPRYSSSLVDIRGKAAIAIRMRYL